MSKIALLLLSVLTIFSCKDNPIDASYKEVMRIHDEVMPLMSKIHKLRKAVSEVPVENDTIKAEVQEILMNLESADENMMVWMAAFSMPKDESEQMKYLENEKVRIQKVSDDMLKAIAKAEEFLKQ